MKNADDMLKTIIKVVDSNGDGKIQYEGREILDSKTYRVGCKHIEYHKLTTFGSI